MSVLYTTRAGIHRPSWQTGCGDKLSSETTRDASGEAHSLSHQLLAQFSSTATMAVMTASAMIRGLSLFHVTLAALLLKNPAIVAKQGVVLVLGQSMQLVRPTSRPKHDLVQITQIYPSQPLPRDFNRPSAATAFLAILFAFIGLSDLTALSLSDEVFDQFWGTQTPVRLAFLFAVTGYSYASKEGGMFAPRTPDYAMGAGASVSNSIVFTWGFFELVTWFFVSILACDGGRGLANAKTQVYTSLRQEKQEKMNQIAEKRKAEEKDQL